MKVDLTTERIVLCTRRQWSYLAKLLKHFDIEYGPGKRSIKDPFFGEKRESHMFRINAERSPFYRVLRYLPLNPLIPSIHFEDFVKLLRRKLLSFRVAVTPRQSEELQKLAFQSEVEWEGGALPSRKVTYLGSPVLFVSANGLGIPVNPKKSELFDPASPHGGYQEYRNPRHLIHFHKAKQILTDCSPHGL